MVFGVFKKLKDGLSKTRKAFTEKVKILLQGRRLDDDTLGELEELMVSSDMGVGLSMEVIEGLAGKYKNKEFTQEDDILGILKQEIRVYLGQADREMAFATSGPTVILVAGVNGSGKTTSIAKIAAMLKQQGHKVMVAAGDTFRAAAVEQLSIWAERVGVDIVKHQTGADPAAVCFDALDAACARDIDVVIVDTAGRLHTQVNLMNELQKINRVIKNKIPDAPHETLLVLDATTGQNGLQQAKKFDDAIDISGLILAKLDGTAKGGVVIVIEKELDIPLKFIGTGENLEDFARFDPDEFVDALFDQ
ncbi:signal recognition particle-docking protein FtsY [Planctomycetota bacterium]